MSYYSVSDEPLKASDGKCQAESVASKRQLIDYGNTLAHCFVRAVTFGVTARFSMVLFSCEK